MSLSVPPSSCAAGMETGWAAGHPGDEPCNAGMGTKSLDGIEAAGELCLGQRGVDFGMADLMQKNGRSLRSATQAGDQMVQALRRIRRNRAIAERADWQVGHMGLRQNPVWRRAFGRQGAS